MKLLIFGGTTEGRQLADILSGRGFAVTVSVATEVGAEALRGIPCRILCGRRTAAEMAALAAGFDLVIDATHPYAREVSENIRTACEAAGVPMKRVRRQDGGALGEKVFSSVADAAHYLSDKAGNVLIATGAKELRSYAALDPRRLYPRVLPTHRGIEACEELGIPHRNIIAMYGPFTREMNEAMLRQYAIRWMVTKDGGKQGGFSEKKEAAAAVGAVLLVIARPEDRGISMEQLLQEMQEEFA